MTISPTGRTVARNSFWSVYRSLLRSRGVPQLFSVDGMSEHLDRTRPLWAQVSAVIAARITEGTYPVGEKVPSVVELSTEFGIAASTAQKALTHLKREGLIRTEVGLGSFVADRAEPAP